jgi:hypothetical protein
MNRKILLLCRTDTAQHVSGIKCPSSGARQTAVAASGFRMNVEVEVFAATDKPTTAENTSTSTLIRKSEAATAVSRAHDDGHSIARNMWSSVCTRKQ